MHHINFDEILSKFCLHKFSPKLNPIREKRVLIFKFSSFCPVNVNQHCIIKANHCSKRVWIIKIENFEPAAWNDFNNALNGNQTDLVDVWQRAFQL